MNIFYEDTYFVGARDADIFNQCRPSSLLELLQESATAAACALHISRGEMYAQYNAIWMLARIWYHLDRPFRWGERVTVRTWHRGGKGASMCRDFDLSVGEERVGEAVSIWVLADQDTRKLFRLSGIPALVDTSGGALCKEKTLSKLKLPDDMVLAEARVLHYSDADMNGHVNNARYADFTCDALHLEQLGQGHFISALQLGYLAECLPGETLALTTGWADGTACVRGADATGKSRFEAALEMRPLPSCDAIVP